MDKLEQTIKDAKRNSTKVALFFLDLNHFKEINDTYGHDYGDEVLKEVCNRLTKTIRENDIVSRLAGDEFTIIMKYSSNPNDIAILAQKIKAAFEAPLMRNSCVVNLSTSIGISIFPDHAKSGEDLLNLADMAMYKAKENSNSTFEIYN